MGNKCEDISVPCICLPKGAPAEEDFNNQMDTMTLFVDTMPLSSATAVIAQWIHEQWPW